MQVAARDSFKAEINAPVAIIYFDSGDKINFDLVNDQKAILVVMKDES